MSKNEQAKKVVGIRSPGTPVFMPCELGYACPLCGEEGEALNFSEYYSFMYCENCNIDIPSCLCVKYAEPKFQNATPLTKKEMVLRATEIYLKSITLITKGGVVK